MSQIDPDLIRVYSKGEIKKKKKIEDDLEDVDIDIFLY